MSELNLPGVAAVRSTRKGIAGDGLIHPASVIALVTLIVNDHVLKASLPGVLTGKLSDFAGLLMFPLLLQAGYEIVTHMLGSFDRPSKTVLATSVVVTGLVFSLVQFDAGFADAYRVLMGHAQAPLSIVGLQEPNRVALTQDAMDLVALPSLIIAWFVGFRRIRFWTGDGRP